MNFLPSRRTTFGLILASVSVSCLRLEVVQQEEGQQAQLHCPINYNGSSVPTITWSRLVNEDYVPVQLDKRISNRTTPIDSSTMLHMLEINKVSRVDSGSYRCESESSRQVVQEILLQVYKLPVIFRNSSEWEEMMWEEDKDLWCWADGYPGLTVIWTRANNQLFNAGEHSYNGQHLRIVKARQEYAGDYICTASISGFHNASVSHEVTLIVEGPPHNYAGQNEFFANPGDNVTLPCAVIGYPEPDVTWSRTGKVMGDDFKRYLVIEDPIHECAKNSSLHIIGVNDDDYETYSCEVKNAYGKSDVHYTVKRARGDTK